jgi:hypothetical protein
LPDPEFGQVAARRSENKEVLLLPLPDRLFLLRKQGEAVAPLGRRHAKRPNLEGGSSCHAPIIRQPHLPAFARKALAAFMPVHRSFHPLVVVRVTTRAMQLADG